MSLRVLAELLGKHGWIEFSSRKIGGFRNDQVNKRPRILDARCRSAVHFRFGVTISCGTRLRLLRSGPAFVLSLA